jgi:glucose-6-phosphate isomerase
VVIGIGGSYLGPEFVFEALKSEKHSREASRGFRLKFLANVDPVDFLHATEDIDFERTLFIICSKTFTTAETMLNARTCKDWLFTKYSPTLSSVNEDVIKDLVAHHMCAVSTNVPLAREFGINPNNVFGFWEWVGGRFSVCSAIGVLPLSLYYGFSIVEQFLKGAECIDKHFFQEKHITKNVPLMLGMIGFWNTHFQKLATRAILPYSQALLKFAPHIQQLNMESNGINLKSISEISLKGKE